MKSIGQDHRRPRVNNARWRQSLGLFSTICLVAILLPAVANAQPPAADDQASSVETGDPRAKPNIVLILSDDQRWSDYGFMNHSAIKTPNLDALAKRGTVFRRGYVPTALCRASLMSLATGHYAFQHRVCGNDPMLNPGERRNSESYLQRRKTIIANIDRYETLAEALGRAGYVSHQSGKWWEGSFKRGGFTEGMTQGFDNHPRGRHGDVGLTIGREGLEPVEAFVDQSVNQKKPFFLWYAPLLPHTPHNPPAKLLDRYRSPDRPLKIAKYMAMCEWFDESCGELFEILDRKKLSDNTLIVYVCDNGWVSAVPKLNSPENWKPAYGPKSKRSSYDGGTRTPIIYSWPASIPNRDRKELATSLDIYPTLLAAAGVTPTTKLPGLNLLEQLKTGQPIERDELFGESFSHDIADPADPERSLINRWCIDGKWKLILSYADVPASVTPSFQRENSKPPQLFDLSEDPNETKNLAQQHPEIVQPLKQKIADWYPVERMLIEK